MILDAETGEVREEEGEGCSNCGLLTRQRLDAEHQLRAVERKLTISLGNEARLRTELENQRNESPEGRKAKALGRYWIARAGKNPKRTKLGEKRLKAVVARLREGRDMDYIARAIDGAVAAGTTSKPEVQRQALLRVMHEAVARVDEETADALRQVYREAMQDVAVFDDLELICRDETKVERFHDLAERTQAPTLLGKAWRLEFNEAAIDCKASNTPF